MIGTEALSIDGIFVGADTVGQESQRRVRKSGFEGGANIRAGGERGLDDGGLNQKRIVSVNNEAKVFSETPTENLPTLELGLCNV